MTPQTLQAVSTHRQRYERFVMHVQRQCQDAGRRSVLRRSLGRRPEQVDYRAHAVVAPFLSSTISTGEERAFYAVASFIAAQPREARDEGRRNGQTVKPETQPPEASNENDEAPNSATMGRRPTNLGTTIAEAVKRRVIAEHTAEARLHLLARQGVDGCHRQLPGLLRMLRGQLIAVDWAQLLHDLVRLEGHRDEVAKQWLQAYYRHLADRPRQEEEPEAREGNDEEEITT